MFKKASDRPNLSLRHADRQTYLLTEWFIELHFAAKNNNQDIKAKHLRSTEKKEKEREKNVNK